MLMEQDTREATMIVLVLESVMLWAFGTSWIVKGNWIRMLNDRQGAV